ncbi:hypothetical protein VPH35_133284 [Triticum aestivum]
MKCQSVSKATPSRTLTQNLRYEFHIGKMFFCQPYYWTPHKGKTERDDAVDSFGKRFRCDDNNNLLSESETPAIKRKRALSQQTHDSDEVLYSQNKKMNPGKTSAQHQKQTSQNIVVDYVNSTPETTKLVKIKAIMLTQKYLKCLTTPDHSSFAAWVDGDVNHGSVYVERSNIVNILKRDGTVPNCTLDVLHSKSGTKWGDNYLKHDMISLPSNIPKNHWFLAVVNSQKREIQILDSLQSSVMENGMQGSRWPDTTVSSWPIIDYEVPD